MEVVNRTQTDQETLNFNAVFDLMLAEELGQEFTLSFKYPATERGARDLKGGNFVSIFDWRDELCVFEITNPKPESRDTGEIVSVEAKHVFMTDLPRNPLVTEEFSGEPAEDLMGDVLDGTRWEVGIVEPTVTRTGKFYNLNPLECLREIERRFNGELKFRCESKGVGFVYIVDLLNRRGTETNIEFSKGFNIQEAFEEMPTDDLRTALYGWGMGTDIDESGETEALDIGGVEWIKGEPTEYDAGEPGPPAPVDKPPGQLWVGDPDAREVYGRPKGDGTLEHVFGEYESQAQTDTRLLWETWYQLQKVNSPYRFRQTEILVADLSAIYEHMTVDTGDIGFVKFMGEALEILRDVRIKRYEYHPKEKEQNRVIVADAEDFDEFPEVE